MSTVLQDHETRRRVYLALEDTAHHLTSQDLSRIAGAADQAHGVVRIRRGSWQVLVGVPEIHFRKLTEELSAMGYRYAGHDEKINEVSTFLLGGAAI
jgi:hypothetical protein